MEEKEIIIDKEKMKIITKLPKEYIEDNNLRTHLDNTIDLTDTIKEVKENDKE